MDGATPCREAWRLTQSLCKPIPPPGLHPFPDRGLF